MLSSQEILYSASVVGRFTVSQSFILKISLPPQYMCSVARPAALLSSSGIVSDLHKTLRRFLKSAAFTKTLLEYAGHGDITARRYFNMNVNGNSVAIRERIWWVLLLLSMFPVYSSQVPWSRSQQPRPQLDRIIENDQVINKHARFWYVGVWVSIRMEQLWQTILGGKKVSLHFLL